ncbi:hypothetical protein GF391_01360 [Candidatus Uhrbacteria bacterium]|nr:hypothetical protein [Candidatus Uhrbacteria bacterium]
MSKFNRGGHGGRGFDRSRGDRGFEKRMFSATCAECGDRCEVPFKPTGEKPVLCNTCFRGGDDRGDRREKRFNKPRREERAPRDNHLVEQFEQLNVKLDLIMKEIEKLKQPNKVYTLEADPPSHKASGVDEKPAKKSKKEAKKAEKAEEVDEEAVADDSPTPEATESKKPAKKTAKKAAKKETKKTIKKKAE